jgi:protein-S-isoprenylcysteine O-methyltransferase Ste14/rhodanese-related sulfurtransferase
LNLLKLIEKYEIRRPLVGIFYSLALCWVVSAWYQGDFSFSRLGTLGFGAAVFSGLLGILLFLVSVLELVTYLIYVPFSGRNVDVLSQVHGELLLHPLTSAILLLTFTVTMLTSSWLVWVIWVALFTVFIAQTYLILHHLDSEVDPPNPTHAQKSGIIFRLLGLILGAEVITMSAGAKPLSPWKAHKLPQDTWIVDVRTRAEFQWNRLNGAENYPWGLGLYDAASGHPKDRPVLVMCFSGHRSPLVTVMLRRMGFETVYNLHWGLLYYMLLSRGTTRQGPFGLTRSSRDTSGRGKDYKAISVGYVITEFLMLVLAPIEKWYMVRDVSDPQRWIGAILGIGGFFAAYLAYRELGRNFRVFAAPRRSGTLIKSGIYSRVRHPMYTAVIFAFLGYVIYWGSRWCFPLWVTMTALYALKAWKEEGGLQVRYPDYQEYKSRTWKFFPYIY